jgi:hypothetical protein
MSAAVALELGVDLGPSLSADEAAAIFLRGEEAVVFALLELAGCLKRAEGRCASVSSAATPSGIAAVHQKPAVATKRGKKPGRKAGHPGSRRAPGPSSSSVQMQWSYDFRQVAKPLIVRRPTKHFSSSLRPGAIGTSRVCC